MRKLRVENVRGNGMCKTLNKKRRILERRLKGNVIKASIERRDIKGAAGRGCGVFPPRRGPCSESSIVNDSIGGAGWVFRVSRPPSNISSAARYDDHC